MKQLSAILAFITIVSLTNNCATAQNKSTSSAQSTGIFPRGQRVPANNFTGNAWVQQLIQPDSAFNIPVGNVTFEAGAPTFWHSHPGGQALLAIDFPNETIRLCPLEGIVLINGIAFFDRMVNSNLGAAPYEHHRQYSKCRSHNLGKVGMDIKLKQTNPGGHEQSQFAGRS